MIRLFPSKVDSKLLLVYCSVVPHDFPPSHRINFVRKLSKYLNVIFIDLPTDSCLSPLSKAVKFYFSLLNTFFKFKYSFVWEFFRFRKLHFFTLYLYLFFQKLFFRKRIILYTTSGYNDLVYRYIPYDKSIFDCPDRHKSEFGMNKDWIKKFDLVFANTKKLYQILKKYNQNTKMVSSGYLDVDTPIFYRQKIQNSALFLGGISQRINYNLLLRVIQRLPEVDFYFIGEVYLDKYYAESKDKIRLKKWQKILNYRNVYYWGESPENYLKHMIPFFKVGLIPYDSSEVFNYYSNPIKLYEYLAYGVNVVSTPLPNVSSLAKKFPVYIGGSSKAFGEQIKLALSRNEKLINKDKNKVAILLRKNSMERKTFQVIKELQLLSAK